MSSKYPLSTNGKKCIGPCYHANTVITHPIYLENVTTNENFCPTDKYIEKNEHGKMEIKYLDKCDNPIVHDNQIHSVSSYEMLFPEITFNGKIFLKTYYNIESFDQGLEWISTNTAPFKTYERVMKNCISEYSDELTIVDNRLVSFVSKLFTTNIDVLYRALYQYIGISDEQVMLVRPDPENKSHDPQIIKQYIMMKLITIDNIQNFLNRYIRNNLKNIEKLKKDEIMNVLVKDFGEYLIAKIDITLKAKENN